MPGSEPGCEGDHGTTARTIARQGLGSAGSGPRHPRQG